MNKIGYISAKIYKNLDKQIKGEYYKYFLEKPLEGNDGNTYFRFLDHPFIYISDTQEVIIKAPSEKVAKDIFNFIKTSRLDTSDWYLEYVGPDTKYSMNVFKEYHLIGGDYIYTKNPTDPENAWEAKLQVGEYLLENKDLDISESLYINRYEEFPGSDYKNFCMVFSEKTDLNQENGYVKQLYSFYMRILSLLYERTIGKSDEKN